MLGGHFSDSRLVRVSFRMHVSPGTRVILVFLVLGFCVSELCGGLFSAVQLWLAVHTPRIGNQTVSTRVLAGSLLALEHAESPPHCKHSPGERTTMVKWAHVLR